MYHEKELLNPRYELFCQEYCKTFNGTQAMIKVSGKSARTCGRAANSTLKRADVRRRIDEILNRNIEQYDELKRRIVNELTTCAFYDFNEFYDLTKMELKDIAEIDGRLIHKCKKNRDGTYSIELVDKLKSLELMGKHLGMFQDKLDVTSNGAPINVTLSSKEVSEAIDAAADE